MEVLSAILTIGTLVFHIVSKINEKSSNSSSRSNYSSSHYEQPSHVLTVNEKLQYMNINNLNFCYATSKINDFNIMNTEFFLLTKKVEGIEIMDIIRQEKCVYIKIKHSIPFNSGTDEFGATFSINCIEPTNNVIVYGAKAYNSNEEVAFYDIANEIINKLSKC
jgi:hypothetical protein